MNSLIGTSTCCSGRAWALLALLVAAALRENFLARMAPGAGASVSIRRRPVPMIRSARSSAPALGVSDRCVSLPRRRWRRASRIAAGPLLTTHPPVVHDPGGVRLHRLPRRAGARDGEGRRARRGAVLARADDPARCAYAGCGSLPHCTSPCPTRRSSIDGRALFERLRLPGVPPRSTAAAARSGPDGGRHGRARPLARRRSPDSGPTGTRRISPARRRRLTAVADVVRTDVARTTAPMSSLTFVRAWRRRRGGRKPRRSSIRSGCRGCHKVGGVGGDDGPDLTREGQKGSGRARLRHVPGERDARATGSAEHFRAPAEVVAGSQMPALGLTDERDRRLDASTCCRSGAATCPRRYLAAGPHARAERFGEREFATDGATLFGTFCAACHGSDGEGMRYPGMAPFPAIGNPDFLAVASDELHRRDDPSRTARPAHAGLGREGRRLRPARDRRAGRGVPAPARRRRRRRPDPQPASLGRRGRRRGRPLFAGTARGCHGATGRGARRAGAEQPRPARNGHRHLSRRDHPPRPARHRRCRRSPSRHRRTRR